MRKHLRGLSKALVVASFAMVLTTAGCGGSSSTGGSGGGGNKNLKIATEFPVSGTDASATIPAQNGVDLAVSQASLPNGYTLTVVHKNDEGASGADASIGAANVHDLVSDSSVIGIVGPFNSSVAKAEIPVVNNAGGPVLISPTNTNPGLTIEQYASANGIVFSVLHPAGKPDYYFRIPANDVAQGKADATIALSPQVNGKTAYVIDDNTTYGKGLADYFTQAYQAGGGQVKGRQSVTPQQVSSFPQLATTIKNSGAAIVFYAGVTSQGGGALKKDLVAAGFNGFMVGGDGIAQDPGWLTTAGSAAVGTVATIAAPDTSALNNSAAQAFISAYKAKFPSADLTAYSAQAYDAANIEIQAIKNVIASGKAVTRSAVRDEVAKISYQGVTGNISFDANGDNTSGLFSVYAVDQTGKWVFQQEITV